MYIYSDCNLDLHSYEDVKKCKHPEYKCPVRKEVSTGNIIRDIKERKPTKKTVGCDYRKLLYDASQKEEERNEK